MYQQLDGPCGGKQLLTGSEPFSHRMLFMEIDQPYILAAAVRFILPETISAETRLRFNLQESEVVLTHQFTRKRSKIISADTAVLLKSFTRPQTLAEVLLQHAAQTGQDPQQLAENVFPLVWELTQEGYLVKENEQKSQLRETLQPGTHFRNFKILEVCQALDDRAVYRVEDEKANFFAL